MKTPRTKPPFFAVMLQTARHSHRTGRICLLTSSLVFFTASLALFGQETKHPLEPADRSSPRAALKTFLDAADNVGAFIKQEYIPDPSRAKFHQLVALNDHALQCLDLSHLSPATRSKKGRAAARDLYETLNRIQLPPFDEIPDTSGLGSLSDPNFTRWVIPNTQITLVRSQSGPQKDEFLFSPETVSKATHFYERVCKLPYTRSIPLKNFREILINNGGWMIPYPWIQALPPWLRIPVCGQPGWKWIALALILIVFLLVLRLVFRISNWTSRWRPFLQSLAQATLPVYLLLATPAITYLALVQINFSGNLGSIIEIASTTVIFLTGTWLCWRMSPVVAEAIIAMPRISPESINAHLIRMCVRLLGIVAGAIILAVGANQLGIPVYGVVAGLGIGGIAIALAAQTTIENLIGGLSLFADKPFVVGDFCQYGTDSGTIETIGIRSARIRGRDRTLTTIPNGLLSKMLIVNFTQRDRMLIQSVISVRYETSPEQLRYLLVKIREMLLGHPRIHHDPARARFAGFGASSLDIEVFAYVKTRDLEEFLGIREDVFLRIMDIVEQSGTSFAFPSQTLYFSRDNGLDTDKAKTAEAQVQQWRDEGCLALPNFSPEQMRSIRGTVVYPPAGSIEATEAKKAEAIAENEKQNSDRKIK